MFRGTVLLAAALAIAAPGSDLVENLMPGLAVKTLIKAGDPLADGLPFPVKNDFTGYVATSPSDGYLLVGHESARPAGGITRLTLRDNGLVAAEPWVTGRHNLCAGTTTPWGTAIVGEEFPHTTLPGGNDKERKYAYTQVRLAPGDPRTRYGWVYEVDPQAQTPRRRQRRLEALGRFSHEGAAMLNAREVYLTEDYPGGFLFRFVATRPRDLSAGALFAYERTHRRWLPIHDPWNAHHEARAAGATPFNRLEGVTVGPEGCIYLSETGDPAVGDPYGRLWKLDPATAAMRVFLEGDGKQLANPDNLLFDPQGGLLICEDQEDPNLAAFGANELLRWTEAKGLQRVLTVVKPFEPSGPSFSPDGRTLFLSIMAGRRSAVLAMSWPAQGL